jgi:hypothetical protein
VIFVRFLMIRYSERDKNKTYRDRLQFDDTTGSALLQINRLCDDRENGINYIFQ